MRNIPKLDGRSMEEIVREIQSKVPFYTPEWNFEPDNPDSGAVLAEIFADMFYGTLKRFNMVPYKNYLSFLNMLRLSPKTVLPSLGTVMFQLSSGVGEPIKIEGGTKLFADSSEDDSKRIVFETMNDFFATPAKLTAICCANPYQDSITIHDREHFPVEFFRDQNGENIQRHRFTLSHLEILSVKSPCAITVEIHNPDMPHMDEEIARKLANPKLVLWKYFTGEAWEEFDEVEHQSTRLVLKKKGFSPLYECVENEEPIGSVSCEAVDMRMLKEVSVKRLKIGSEYLFREKTGVKIKPDAIYSNDYSIEDEGGYCFGKRPVKYDCFYIGSREVFSKKGAEIHLEMRLLFELDDIQNGFEKNFLEFNKYIIDKRDLKKERDYEIYVSSVLWEYWNGLGWAKLPVKSAEHVFYEEKEVQRISFILPEDMEACFIQTGENFFIRARVMEIANGFALHGKYKLPFLKELSLDYCYHPQNFKKPTQILIENNCEKTKLHPAEGNYEHKIHLLKAMKDEYPAVYLCFDGPPHGNPIQLFFSVNGRNSNRFSLLKWEGFTGHSSNGDFRKLKVLDGTDNLKGSGIVKIFNGADYLKQELWGMEGYWIRIVHGEKEMPLLKHEYHLVEGISMNAVAISQQETFKEVLYSLDANDLEAQLHLLYKPVILEEIWVNEFSELSREEMADWMLREKNRVTVKRNDVGEIIEFWIRWQRVEDFLASMATDRHYTLDAFEGIIRFGNGKNGKRPLAGSGNIMVHYSVGGGSDGNVPPGSINTLAAPIAYVDKVTNLEATFGGSDRQTIESVAQLGPQILKNRGRAVTRNDFIHLIRENFIEVAKVECLANVKPDGSSANGHITMVVMPKDYLSHSGNTALCERIKKFLQDRMDCNLRDGGRFSVIPPVIMTINVTVEISVENPEDSVKAEKQVLTLLDEYLHPIKGAWGKGWNIGKMPVPTEFYNLVKNASCVDYVKKVSVEGSYMENNRQKYVALDDEIDARFAVTVNGKHSVII